MAHQGALAQQVAVVTGGGRGIGAAIARRLAEMAAQVVICGRNREQLASTAETIRSAGGRCELQECDVQSLAEVERLASFVDTTFARCDILVNNAGVGSFRGPLHTLPPEDWERIFNTNLRAVFYTMRAFAPMMIARRYGHIINISSIASKNAVPNAAAYAASKWGLNGLSVTAAEELRGNNIRVSIVCPGSTATDMMGGPGGFGTGRAQERMLRPSDVAHVVAMLATQAPQSFASEVILRPTQKP